MYNVLIKFFTFDFWEDVSAKSKNNWHVESIYI